LDRPIHQFARRHAQSVRERSRPFTAAALGAMAWHPPIFLNNGAPSVPGNLSATTWPQQSFSPARPTATLGLDNVPGWPQSILAPLAQLDPSDAPGSMDQPIGLFSRNPALRYGLFGSDPDPTSPFASAPLGAAGLTAAVPTTLGTPGASYTLGLGPRLPLLAQFRSPVEASTPALDPLIGPAAAPYAPVATPPRSVLFNCPPAPWDLGGRERDLQNLDQSAQSLGISELPISKSSQPIVPPRPQLATAQEQALYAARLLSPNLVDYFTKTPPPPPPFPSTPGKIPSADSNPYAPGALVDVLNSAILAAAVFSGGEAAPLALARFAGKTGATASAEELAALSARAKEIHAALDGIAQRQRTTAVLSTDGDTIIAGGKRDLSPKQKALLRPWERAGDLPGAHAETSALYNALKAGLTPRALATTRPICADCQAAIEDLDGILTSKTTAIFPPVR
jgi:hypothetical protein